jgi:hypothetical protein
MVQLVAGVVADAFAKEAGADAEFDLFHESDIEITHWSNLTHRGIVIKEMLRSKDVP